MRRSIVAVAMLLLLTPCVGADGFDVVTVDDLRRAGKFAEVTEALNSIPDENRTPDVVWRMARAEYDHGRIADADTDRKRRFEMAMVVAKQAIAADPENAGGYKWLAISQGILAQESGTKRKVELSRGVKENILLALERDPNDDFSLLVLGKWNYSVATLGFFSRAVVKVVYGGLPDASLAESEKLIRQALLLRKRPIHHYNLARVLDETDRGDEAISELEKAIMLDPTYPHEQDEIAAAKKMLTELRD